MCSTPELPEMLLEHPRPASYMGLHRSRTNGYVFYQQAHMTARLANTVVRLLYG